MKCEQCHGSGVVETAYKHEPCTECGGCGQVSCCQGHEGQPLATGREKMFLVKS